MLDGDGGSLSLRSKGNVVRLGYFCKYFGQAELSLRLPPQL